MKAVYKIFFSLLTESCDVDSIYTAYVSDLSAVRRPRRVVSMRGLLKHFTDIGAIRIHQI